MYRDAPQTWSVSLIRARGLPVHAVATQSPDGSVSSQVDVAIGGVQVVWAASRVLAELNASALTGWWLGCLPCSQPNPDSRATLQPGEPVDEGQASPSSCGAPSVGTASYKKCPQRQCMHPSEIPLESGLHEFAPPACFSKPDHQPGTSATKLPLAGNGGPPCPRDFGHGGAERPSLEGNQS